MAAHCNSDDSEDPIDQRAVGQILQEIRRVEEKLMHSFSTHSNAVRTENSKLRAEIGDKMSEVLSFVSSLTPKQSSSHSGPSGKGNSKSRKRDLPAFQDVEYLDQLVSHENVQPRVVQVALMLIVMCFVNEYPHLSSWVPLKMKDTMSALRCKLGGVSGFSLMYFSKTKDENRMKWGSKIGTLWSWMISSSIVIIILTARTTEFEKKQRQAPGWMRSFGDFTSAMEIVEPVVDCLEKHNIVPLVKQSGKRHKNSDAEVSSVLDKDPLRGSMELAIDCLRSVVLSVLTDGRMKSRTVIFKRFLFVMERIKEHSTVEEARTAGFAIELCNLALEEELRPPGVIWQTIWAIGKAQTVTTDDSAVGNVNHANLRAFKRELENKFMCMNGAVAFRKDVLPRTPDDEEDAPTHPEVHDANLTMDFRETFNLHRVAATILVEKLGVRNLISLLSSSALSLRAIHITALALRGMICRMFSRDREPVEENALGDTSLTVLDKDDCDNLATVAMGKLAERGKLKDSAKLKALRKERRYMSWDDYKKEKERRMNIPQSSGVADGATTSSANCGVAVLSPQNVDISWTDGN